MGEATQPLAGGGSGDAAAAVMRTPRNLDIEITSRCNARCSYCYYFENESVSYEDLPAAEWLAFFAELGRLGIMYLTIAGGEPFLRDDLPELLRSVAANRMRFALLSNGALIDDDMASFLAATGRCDYVQVSVDGSCPEVHDPVRGDGSFAGAVHGIRTLQAQGVPVAVRLTVHRGNVSDLAAAAAFLLDELGLPGFSTNSVGYLGSCRGRGAELLLDDGSRAAAMRALLDLDARYPGRIDAQNGPLAEARRWPAMEAARIAGASAWAGGGSLSACGCASSKLAVRSDGSIIVCSLLPHLVLGRINRDPLDELWLHSPLLEAHRRRAEVALDSFEFCADCGYRPYCTGNCPAVGFELTGQVDHPCPESCLRAYIQRGGELVDEPEGPVVPPLP